jgi:hypothetical protein
MRTLTHIRFHKDQFSSCFPGRACGFRERIGGLHRDVDAAVRVVLIGVDDDGHLRETIDRPVVVRLEPSRQLYGDDGRTLLQNLPPHLEGELDPARNHREIGIVAASEIVKIRQG